MPAPGSLITVSGTFAKEEAALDGYWIKEGAALTTANQTLHLEFKIKFIVLELSKRFVQNNVRRQRFLHFINFGV